MATALAALARQARIELLYDRALVRGLSARAVHGRLSAEAALSRLLAGSGLGYRTTADGVFVLFAIPAAQPVQTGDGAVSELLVVGRRTQNVDIRRTRNDIQPYQVFDRREIETAQRDSVDDFLRARASANTQAGPLALHGGESRSSINLRGFGETSTLVLVDGRPMPLVPTLARDFSQADINGIPPGTIERIEVLTTTAGGIYGPGAIGGVVNVVLRRDYRGADLTAYAGGADRGDAGRFRIEGRLGFTPDHGDTDVMLFVAHSESAPLRNGSRDYAEHADRLRFANDPDEYLYGPALTSPNGVLVVGAEDLTLSPDLGGAALGSRFTYLPLGFTGSRADAAALLAANAGKLPPGLSDDASGKRTYIATSPSSTSGLLNIRRRIGPRVEVYFDGLYLKTTGRWVGAIGQQTLDLAASQPDNPFEQDVWVTFPVGVAKGVKSYRFETGRLTTGAIVNLARGWKASADYTWAPSQFRRDTQTTSVVALGYVGRGSPGAQSEAPVAPLQDWADVLAALPTYARNNDESLSLHERLSAASLRLAGPLATLPGGPLTATVLAEQRDDRVSGSQAEAGFRAGVPSRRQRIQYGYLELRAPLGASDEERFFLRGLELQLAVRHDRALQHSAAQYLDRSENAERFSVSHDATTFTAGARVLPTSKLLLRASVATGERLPTPGDLQSAVGVRLFAPGQTPRDPRRAGRLLGSEGSWTMLLGGSPRVGSARARSFTLGAVLNPDGRGGPRLSADYSRIVVSDEPAAFYLTPAQLLAAEAQYPDRVIRAPVTATDTANGFAVGRVISLDTTYINAGRTVAEAVDVQIDWRLPTTSIGDFRVYGVLTWQPTFRSRQSPDAPTIDKVGYFDGPLEWRGNAGLEWGSGPLSADINVQYYSSYRVTYADPSDPSNVQYRRFQGAERVPAQAYVDLALRRRFTASLGAGPPRMFEARISIQNLFDKRPPIVATSPDLGFSEYGDPSGRRIAAALSARF